MPAMISETARLPVVIALCWSSDSFAISAARSIQPAPYRTAPTITEATNQRPTSAIRSINAQGTGRRGLHGTSGSRGGTPNRPKTCSMLAAASAGTRFQLSAIRAAAASHDQKPAMSTAIATNKSAAAAIEGDTSVSLPREDAGGGDDVFEARIDRRDHGQPDGNVQRPVQPAGKRLGERASQLIVPQSEQAGDDRDALKDHFQLASHLGREIAPLLLDEAANGGDEHFA